VAVERLQKILAHAGLASRRAAEALITDGRVRVNGKLVTELGARADGRRDRIEVDGKRIALERPVYYLLHKPRGVVSTLSDPEGRPSLGELLTRFPERLYPVGRLDFHTSGALLITNDGELAEALLHPSRKVPKVYVAKLRGDLDTDALDGLRNGVELDDGFMTAPADVIVLREEAGSTWIRITIHEGKNRQIIRMGDAIGHTVTRLARISFAGIDTEGLRPGHLRPLEEKEVEKLKVAYLVPARARKLGQKRSAAHAAREAANDLERAVIAEPDDDGELARGDDVDGEIEAAEWHAEPVPPVANDPNAPSYPRERSRTPRVTKHARETARAGRKRR
jgi:23S rRNA pseudouridine2605 synthase